MIQLSNMGILTGNGSEVATRIDSSPKPQGTATPSVLRSTALVERQHYIEKIFYSSAPLQVNKAITSEMKAAVLDPISLSIHASQNAHEGSKGSGKPLPSLLDWQAGRTQSLAYEDFKAVVAQEAKHDRDVDKELMQQEYVIRSISNILHLVNPKDSKVMESGMEKAAQYAVAPPRLTAPLEDANLDVPVTAPLSPSEYTDEQKRRYESILDRLQRSKKIANQMKSNGIDYTLACYKHAQEVESATSSKQLDIAETDIKKLKKSELRDELRARVQAKKQLLKEKGVQEDSVRTALNSEMSADMLNKQYSEAWKYMSSLIPDKDRRFWDRAPNSILKLAISLRRVLPVENAEILAQMWWQLRLGGARAKDIYSHLEKEWPEFVKVHNLKRYTEHLADNYLSSEAAGFEFQNKLKVPENATPNKLLFQTMKDLIHHHIPKNQDFIRFTLLDGDSHVRKINLPYHEGITDEEIRTNISSVLSTSHWVKHNLDERDIAELSYKGYSAQDREKDPRYVGLYKGFGQDSSTRKDYEGDYLIQVGGIYNDSRDPRSLFAVDSHKAAIQLQFAEPGKVSITARYSHPYFDGVPAQSHSSALFKGLTSDHATGEAPTLLPPNREVSHLLSERIAKTEGEAKVTPLVEARADYDDNAEYKKIPVGSNKQVLTPTDMRSLILARANGIQYFQQLVAGKAEGTYFLRNPNSNNVQPVVVAPINLNEKNKAEWVQEYRKAVDRAKDGVGDVALFSAITGTREGPLAFLGGALNPQLTNMLSHAQGMISPVPGSEGGVSFTTADSNAYRPSKIDLNDAVPSMGAIGMYLRKEGSSHYTVRLLPSQAQRQFRDAALRLLPSHATAESQTRVLKEFTKIIKAWDNLVGGNGYAMSLDKFESIRDGVFNKLAEEELLDVEKLAAQDVLSGEGLQKHLNGVLQKAAHDVFNPGKIDQARKELMTLLR